MRILTPNLASPKVLLSPKPKSSTALVRRSIRRPWLTNRTQWTSAFVHRYARLVAEYGLPEAIHFHGAARRVDPTVVARIRESGVAVFSTEHETTLIDTRIYDERLAEFWQNCDRVSAVGRKLQQVVQCVMPAKEIGLLPNLVEVDPAYFRPAVAPDKLTFVTACNLIDTKQVDRIIKAFGLLCKRRNGILTIIGDGPQRKYLQELAIACCPSGTVVFTGEVDQREAWKYMADAAVYVNCSRTETFGVAVGEALCLGLLAVCTPSGGPEDFVTAEFGHVTRSDDVAEIAAGMERVGDRSLTADRRRLHAHAKEILGRESFIARYRDLYPKAVYL